MANLTTLFILLFSISVVLCEGNGLGDVQLQKRDDGNDDEPKGNPIVRVYNGAIDAYKTMAKLLNEFYKMAFIKKSNDDELSSMIVEILQNFSKKILIPWEIAVSFPFMMWLRLWSLPFQLVFSLPALNIDAAQWYIQPFPIRLIQAIMPLLTRGNVNLLTVWRKLIYPLPLRMLLAFVPHFTGPYKLPQGYTGMLPENFRPHFKYRASDGSFRRFFDRFLPTYYLHFKIPDFLYSNILDRLPKKLRNLRDDLGIPTIIVKPWQILGLFPRFFTEGPDNSSIKTALLLLRIGAPLVFITFFLNIFNVPGAILLAFIFTVPTFFTFNPLRWLNPIIGFKLLLGLKPRLPLF